MTDHGGLICVVGSINEDTTLRVPVLPAAGETVLATSRARSGGGKGANQAAAAAALGAEVAFVGAVGDDDAGRLALADLKARHVDVGHVEVRAGGVTGNAVVVVGDDGENLIIVDQGVNGDLQAERVAQAVTSLAPTVTLGQLEVPVDCLVAAAHATRPGQFVLNPAPMPNDPGRLAELLPLCDVLVPNRSELGRLVGKATPTTTDEVDACVALLDFGRDLVVTLGSEGAVVYSERRRTPISPVDVDAVDTSGAGDVFCGVLAHRLAAGDSLLAAATAANTAAARSTTIPGAQVPPDFSA